MSEFARSRDLLTMMLSTVVTTAPGRVDLSWQTRRPDTRQNGATLRSMMMVKTNNTTLVTCNMEVLQYWAVIGQRDRILSCDWSEVKITVSHLKYIVVIGQKDYISDLWLVSTWLPSSTWPHWEHMKRMMMRAEMTPTPLKLTSTVTQVSCLHLIHSYRGPDPILMSSPWLICDTNIDADTLMTLTTGLWCWVSDLWWQSLLGPPHLPLLIQPHSPPLSPHQVQTLYPVIGQSY